MDKIKMTSIIRVVEGLTQIDVDYVVYDPYNEYKSVYVEVIGAGEEKVIYLSKVDTHITIENLKANTDYRLNFVYTTSKKIIDPETKIETEELVPNTFETFDLKTKMPQYSISVYKISQVYNRLTYKVDLQKGYVISKVKVNLSFKYDAVDSETLGTVEKTASIDDVVNITDLSKWSVLGNFDISGYDIDEETVLVLTIKNVVSGDIELPINTSYSFRFGRKLWKK